MDYVLLYLILPLGIFIRRTKAFAHRPDPTVTSYLNRKS
ncbi:hypothetical protein AB7M22_001613 [Pseudomonas sp. ADAK2 TE3594]|jgi:hypothetical protein|nr:hypothetical protein PMI18_00807 [Pseudomonas sp. GM102]